MNGLDVERRLEEIRNAAHDPDEAHSLEDKLVWDFVRAVALGKVNNPRALAILVLLSRKIRFRRFTA